MRTQRVLSVGVFAIALLATACSSSSDKASSTASTGSSSTTSSMSSTSSTSSSASSTRCMADQLKGSVGETQSGAGQRYTALILTNTSTKVCDMRGFPGVSLLDSSSKQIGQPASRDGNEGPTLTLQPGASASTTLHTSASGMGAACEPASAQIKVYPPDNTASLSIAATYTACGGFKVSTLVAGTTGS
ncbi:MAG: DUF4232 domain-containing protein [Actinobacteria bacterium]|nr:DUF4232 domain-containing protein [Actinomycetota bacterium]MTA41986.1 DUF4232 domain-containing protein [Actinomycetota bacterium]MTB22937.1 DUF4232 domain-containing protein [Actinomycetota bacterium]